MQDLPRTLGIQIKVQLDMDAEELEYLTWDLRRELLELDVEAVELPPRNEVLQGFKGMEPTALGSLAVTFVNSQQLTAVIAEVRSWLARSPRRRIELSLDDSFLELSVPLSEEQQRLLIDNWLRRHRTG